MRVLWFANTPCLGSKHLNSSFTLNRTGGWLESLNANIENHLELGVVFHYPKKISNFNYSNTEYFPVYTGNIIIENFKRLLLKMVYDDEFLFEYLRIIDEFKPDVIHIHGTENTFLCLLDQLTIPIIVSIQGNLSVYSHKYLSGYHGRYLSKTITSHKLHKFFQNIFSFKTSYELLKKHSLIEKKRMPKIKHILGRTSWDNRISRVLAPESVYFHADELLRNSFYHNTWSNLYNSGKLIIFTTSSDSYYKGFETIVYTFSLLSQFFNEIEWRVSGINCNSLIVSITKRFLGNIYPGFGISLLGSLNENEIIQNLKECHLYVMPSHIENSPNNLCEAMILGVPCVATNVGGTSSILQDGVDGILVQDGDPWSMAGAILEIHNNKQLLLKFSNNSRMKSLKRHNVTNVIATYKTIYSEIIQNNSI